MKKNEKYIRENKETVNTEKAERFLARILLMKKYTPAKKTSVTIENNSIDENDLELIRKLSEQTKRLHRFYNWD